MITFDSPGEATSAYKSPEPVFNNRFIKVFFHNPDREQQVTVNYILLSLKMVLVSSYVSGDIAEIIKVGMSCDRERDLLRSGVTKSRVLV